VKELVLFYRKYHLQAKRIRDVIEYTDREDDDGIIIFLDQQKAFDRVEWGWADHVLSKFNFGGKHAELSLDIFPIFPPGNLTPCISLSP
jgi:hypothetical protein